MKLLRRNDDAMKNGAGIKNKKSREVSWHDFESISINEIEMRKITFLLLLLTATTVSFAQNNPRPTKSRFWNSNRSTFMLRPGDILVYNIEENGQKYDFIATIRKFGETISYDYKVPGKDEKGSIAIPRSSVKSGFTYYNVFSAGDKPKDKNSLWLSKDNFRGLATPEKQTKMDMGNGLDTFTRATTATQKINYKGRERLITVYKIAGQDSTSSKELWVMNDIDNPLITNLNGGATITLKEVR